MCLPIHTLRNQQDPVCASCPSHCFVYNVKNLISKRNRSAFFFQIKNSIFQHCGSNSTDATTSFATNTAMSEYFEYGGDSSDQSGRNSEDEVLASDGSDDDEPPPPPASRIFRARGARIGRVRRRRAATPASRSSGTTRATSGARPASAAQAAQFDRRVHHSHRRAGVRICVQVCSPREHRGERVPRRLREQRPRQHLARQDDQYTVGYVHGPARRGRCGIDCAQPHHLRARFCCGRAKDDCRCAHVKDVTNHKLA